MQYLNANHREISKFESPNDPNYITLKNALVSATEELLAGGRSKDLNINLILMFYSTSGGLPRFEAANENIEIISWYTGST